MVNKITEADLINKGVVGLPDVPGLTTIEMQNKFEEISRDVIIPRFNELIDCTVSASDEFSKLSTYNVGDYCIYQSVLYKCTTEINTAGEWDATKWKATAIDKELKEISSTPENKDAISDKYDSSKTYAVGDYCIYNDTLYKCKTAVTSAEEFDSSKWEATNCGKELVALNSNLSEVDKQILIANSTTKTHTIIASDIEQYKKIQVIAINKTHHVCPEITMYIDVLKTLGTDKTYVSTSLSPSTSGTYSQASLKYDVDGSIVCTAIAGGSWTAERVVVYGFK